MIYCTAHCTYSTLWGLNYHIPSGRGAASDVKIWHTIWQTCPAENHRHTIFRNHEYLNNLVLNKKYKQIEHIMEVKTETLIRQSRYKLTGFTSLHKIWFFLKKGPATAATELNVCVNNRLCTPCTVLINIMFCRGLLCQITDDWNDFLEKIINSYLLLINRFHLSSEFVPLMHHLPIDQVWKMNPYTLNPTKLSVFKLILCL